jgi:hypothetical protein
MTKRDTSGRIDPLATIVWPAGTDSMDHPLNPFAKIGPGMP